MLLYCVVILGFISSSVKSANLSRLSRNADNVNGAVNSLATLNVTSSTKTFPVNASTENTSLHSSAVNLVNSTTNDTNGSNLTKVSEKSGKKYTPQSGLQEMYSKYASGAALRGLYVFAGLSAVVLLYISVKIIRLRRRKTNIRKYGLLANAEDLEMTPLDAEDDDEDTTLFDAHNHIGR